MMNTTLLLEKLLWGAGFVLLAPIAGGLLAGFDRIITARMQARKGPPLFQPF
jgi:ech hydrogenase subunit B